MQRIHKSIILTIVLAIGLISVAEAGISRVARRWNFVQVRAGYAQPMGENDHLFNIRYEDQSGAAVNLDADELYDPSWYLGFSYGQLRSKHIAFSLGFTYTDIEMVDSIATSPYIWQAGAKPALNQYDVDFDLNYLLTNPSQAKISPFVGLGFHAGITSLTADGFESENELTMALGVNFGADIVLWESSDKRTFVALSSINEFQFLASEERPKYLNLGVGLKYYFRP